MKISSSALLALTVLSTASAFVPSAQLTQAATQLHASKDGDTSWQNLARQAFATAAVTASLWSAPAFLAGNDNMPFATQTTAVAKEMASGSGSRVNKDPDSLLRYGLPINSKEVRKLQVTLEDIKLDIGSKRKSAALDGVKKSKSILATKDADKIKAACRDPSLCDTYIKSMSDGLDPLSAALKDSMDSFNGSDQERAALDKAYAAQDKVVRTLSKLEEQMVPAGYKTPVPEEYSDLAQLNGRATVEMLVKKADGSTFDVNGQSYPEAKMTMIIDGYGSPVTAGNFIDLVQKGFYNKMQIQRSDGFVVQTGKPDGQAEGYVGTPSKSVGKGKNGERLIPLEIFPKGDKGPFYERTIEDEGRGGEATVLPFNSYGAMGWAREEYDPNSGSSQFFWLLFDSDLTPAGKNVLDGRYPCFGYVVEGADFLGAISEGDVISYAKVTEGAENLVQPE